MRETATAFAAQRRPFALARNAGLAALLCAGGIAGAQQAQAPQLRYDIPAGRLGPALARYSERSGVDVLLDEPQAAAHPSNAVSGLYSAPQALAILLRGTGLMARFTSPRSAVILPEAHARGPLPEAAQSGRTVIALDMLHVTAPRMIGGSRAGGDMRFLLAMAGAIRAIVVKSALIDPVGRSKVRIQTRIDEDGTLRDVRVIAASGSVARDADLVRLLEGRTLALEPPADLRQPILFDVAVR